MSSSTLLRTIWKEQVDYNNRVRQTDSPKNYEYWMKQYLLGAVSEVDSVLEEIHWKIHRRGKPVDRTNLSRELADLTKYVLSMWEWSGFSMEEMLLVVHDKNMELDQQWHQDWECPIKAGTPIVITDLDGTLGNYRKAFYEWLMKEHSWDLPVDKGQHHLAMEIDLGLPYRKYAAYKEQFEAEGGYKSLEPYSDSVEAIQELSEKGVHILAYTARPAQRYSRIWQDSWQWLIRNNLATYIAELRIGLEARIQRACELQEQGHQVVLLEDDPSTALRAAQAGIFVMMRAQPYNEGVAHRNISRWDEYDAGIIYYVYLRQEPSHATD